jgi:hypothetical protein
MNKKQFSPPLKTTDINNTTTQQPSMDMEFYNAVLAEMSVEPEIVDPEIYALYSNTDDNICASQNCNKLCGGNGHCSTHFHDADFANATKHSHFANKSQKLVIRHINTDFSHVYELFDMLPPEILTKIVKCLHFPDLKQLYVMRVPAILALVQGKLVFNHDVLTTSYVSVYRTYKFTSDYARGLHAIDRAIHMTRTSGKTRLCTHGNNEYEEMAVERDRTNDRRHFTFDTKNGWYFGASSFSKEMAELKAKPVQAYKADIAHSIGFRRVFPGIFGDHATCQYINNFVYDDFFSKNPAETERLISKYQQNPSNYRLTMTHMYSFA